MTNFWDLPTPVRQKIYRLALVREERITSTEHSSIVRQHEAHSLSAASRHRVPPLLRISEKAEIEAAPVYYGGNHFEFTPVHNADALAWITRPRHLRLIRRVTCSWRGPDAHSGFLAIGRMKGLQELYIRVDEREMVLDTLGPRYRGRRHVFGDPTPQQQLAILRHPGMNGLLSISGVPHVEFIKQRNYKDEEVGGPIPGGILEAQVLRKITGMNSALPRIGLEDETFPFLSLPPEIRNRIYDLLLCVPGELHPSKERPSSQTRKGSSRRGMPQPTGSALNLLAVNKQIYDEAMGTFYHRNSFEFYHPTEFHAFTLSLSQERLSFLREITLYYQNNKSGGIDLAELTFPLLKQLPRLRRLHVILRNEIEKKISGNRFLFQTVHWMEDANPLLLPGIKTLFSLRGVTDIKLRDLALESEYEKAKSEKDFPDFSLASRFHFVVQLANAVVHLNNALADAQIGKVNKKLLDDPQWHMKEVFPTMD